jgi:anti-sigma regulatory factor (Ser/Thr protein kinase)
VIPTHQPRRCALELEALPSRVGHVRRIVSAQLRRWQLDQLTDPVLLGVSELLANVHRHAGPDKHCAVELCFAEGRLTVSVHDHDPRPPRAGLRAGPLETSGRGLALLEALTDSWGSRPEPDGTGKVVWFALCGPAFAADPPPLPESLPEPVTAPAPGPAARTAGPQPVAVRLA